MFSPFNLLWKVPSKITEKDKRKYRLYQTDQHSTGTHIGNINNGDTTTRVQPAINTQEVSSLSSTKQLKLLAIKVTMKLHLQYQMYLYIDLLDVNIAIISDNEDTFIRATSYITIEHVLNYLSSLFDKSVSSPLN